MDLKFSEADLCFLGIYLDSICGLFPLVTRIYVDYLLSDHAVLFCKAAWFFYLVNIS